MGSFRTFSTGCIAAFAILGTAATALAQEPDLVRARVAYDRGVRANAARDHAGAARAFAEADALAPQTASLEAALESAMKADDALLGAELVDRADGRAPDLGLRTTLEAARKRFAGRTGKVRIECKGEARCLAAVDGIAADARKPIYVAAGPHAVVLQWGEQRIDRLVDVRPDATVTVSPLDPTQVRSGQNEPGAGGGPKEPGSGGGPKEPGSGGISPIWFYVGIGATAVVGGITVVSGLDAVSLHDRFEAVGCGSGGAGRPASDCGERGREGESAQLRTNVLLGATAALAVTTAVLGIFAVRWKDGSQGRITVGTARGAAMAGFELVTP
jgi:hypothetical protein